MTVEDALRSVRLGTVAERIAAAQHLAETATTADLEALKKARRRELDHYVKVSIDRAIVEARRRPAPQAGAEVAGEDDEPAVANSRAAIRSEAIRETTARVVHELTRVIGFVGANAEDEISNYESSQTAASLERLLSLIQGVDLLGRAAAAPTCRQFELGPVIRDVCAVEASRHPDVNVAAEGPDALVVRSDPGLLRLVLHNGIGNACEATLAIHEAGRSPVVVNWGQTDSDVWIAILDRGEGLKDDGPHFQFGHTKKRGHDGVGLALVAQAAESLGAIANLERRRAGGVMLEIRWPAESEAA